MHLKTVEQTYEVFTLAIPMIKKKNNKTNDDY